MSSDITNSPLGDKIMPSWEPLAWPVAHWDFRIPAILKLFCLFCGGWSASWISYHTFVYVSFSGEVHCSRQSRTGPHGSLPPVVITLCTLLPHLIVPGVTDEFTFWKDSSVCLKYTPFWVLLSPSLFLSLSFLLLPSSTIFSWRSWLTCCLCSPLEKSKN